MKIRTIIIISIILVIVIGSGIYFAWKNASKVLNPPIANNVGLNIGASTSTTISGNIEGSEQGKLFSNDSKALDFWVYSSITTSTATSTSSSTANLVFYITPEGSVFQAKDGEDEKIFDALVINPISIYASSLGTKAIVKYDNEGNIGFKLIDVVKKTSENLIAGITSVAWSPDGKTIAYFIPKSANSDEYNLYLQNAANLKQKPTLAISFIGEENNLIWISTQKIIILPRPTAFYSNQAWSIDLKNKTISSFGAEAAGEIIKWYPSVGFGMKFESGKSSALSFIKETGEKTADIDFKTLPEKCDITKNKIMYCAVPGNFTTKTMLPDDYYKNSFYSVDYLLMINLNNNETSGVTGVDNEFDAKKLIASGNNIYFLNRYDQNIYALEISE